MGDFISGLLTTIIGSAIGAIVSVLIKKPNKRQIWWILFTGIIIGGIMGYIARPLAAPFMSPSYITVKDSIQSVNITIIEPQDQKVVPRVIWTKGTFYNSYIRRNHS